MSFRKALREIMDPNGGGFAAAYDTVFGVPRKTGTVADYPDDFLLSRAVRGCRDHTASSGHRHPRWVAVSITFGVGSTYAMQLCRRFDLDPTEKVARFDDD